MTFQEKLERFRARVEAEQFQNLQRKAPKLAEICPDYYAVTIKPGKKYTKVDVGTSGKFMVTQDGEIFGIKGYGVIHRGHRYGTLDTIDQYWWGEYGPIKGGKPQWRE